MQTRSPGSAAAARPADRDAMALLVREVAEKGASGNPRTGGGDVQSSPRDDRGARRRGRRAARGDLLSEAAEERPLLCVVDDAQWLDRASAHAPVFVARRLLAESVVLLFAERLPSDEFTGLPELVVEGLGDADARLFISQRTVAYHLRKVFSKLDITSRNQLGRVLPLEPSAALQ